ncbi:hypothetical protein BC936DRAFT_137289 [Jimgerdemannia flammicorona]|uniref:Uncharacterized protein n=1 Tax=Jimgerdemannia flammicorona TaxID=994334 RepID=A0A433CXQ5_9FUNG|nr:hypothetical protein BC936DRAFT_137289 [Jimgerdemannia flammicorona]
MQVDIPWECQPWIFSSEVSDKKACLKRIGVDPILVEMYTQHTTNSHTVCYFHKQFEIAKILQALTKELVNNLTQKTEELTDAQQKLGSTINATHTKVSQLENRTTDALDGLGATVANHVEIVDRTLYKTVEAVTNATERTNALIEQKYTEILESAKSWIPLWATGVIAILQTATGLSYIATVSLLAVMIIVAGIIWSFELNRKWKLAVIAAGFNVYSGACNLQAMLTYYQAIAMVRIELLVGIGGCSIPSKQRH